MNRHQLPPSNPYLTDADREWLSDQLELAGVELRGRLVSTLAFAVWHADGRHCAGDHHIAVCAEMRCPAALQVGNGDESETETVRVTGTPGGGRSPGSPFWYRLVTPLRLDHHPGTLVRVVSSPS